MRHTGVWALLGALTLGLSAAGARADAFDDIVAPGTKVEKIAHGFRFVEGPVWHPGGWLLFSDIWADTIYRWTPGPRARRGVMGLPAPLVGRLRVFRRPSDNSNGLALDAQSRLVAAEHGRRVTRSDGAGEPVVLAERFEGQRFNSPNDLAIKRDGSIYVTDPSYGLRHPKLREIAFNGVFRIAPDGRVTLLEKSIPYPNGIAFTPDESHLYISDSGDNKLYLYEVRPDGTLGTRRLIADVVTPGIDEGPDGVKVDARGNVYCAGPDGVWIFDASGRLLGKIPMPEVPSNLAFGGDDGATLFITARTGVYRIALRTSARAAAVAPR